MPEPNADSGPPAAEAYSGRAPLPEGFVNRGVMIMGEAPGGLGSGGGSADAEEQAKKERRRQRDRENRERRKRQQEEREAAAQIGEAATSAVANGSSTREGEVSYRDASAPNITIHGPTYEAPTYEGPTFNNNPIQMVNPDINPNITVNGGGSGRGNGGENPGERDSDQDPDDNPNQGRNNGETQQLRDDLEEANRKIGELNDRLAEQETRYQELEQRNQELQQRNEELQAQNAELQARIDALENPPPPPGPTPEELEQAKSSLEAARDELARIDIRRSARITDRFTDRRRIDAEDYEEAVQNYAQALEAYAQIMIARERAQGTAEQQIRRNLILLRYDESAAYANRVVDINDENFNNLTGFRRRIATGLRRWSDMPTRYKVGLGIGLGAGVGFASLMTGGGLALLVGGSAARFSMGLINHQASLRNVSRHSLNRQLRDIRLARQDAMGNLGNGSLDDEPGQLAQATEEERRANTRGNIRRNRRGTALMVGGAVLAGAGLLHAAGANIPDAGWTGLHRPDVNLPNLHNPTDGGSSGGPDSSNLAPVNKPPGLSPWGLEHSRPIDMSHFHPDQFSAKTPHEAVRGMFGVIGRNNIQIHGANKHVVAAIARDMQQHHWHLASGMEQAPGHMQQHIVDVSKDWADGQTANANASALQGLRRVGGSSTENWEKFMELAQRHGVTFTERG